MTLNSINEQVLGQIRIGPAGWSYADWAGIVYPAPRGRAFDPVAYLADFFDTIEINTSFYRPIRRKLAEQWIERIARNPDFVFTAKLWELFTHIGEVTPENERLVREGFFPLFQAGKLGAVLLQFPFSFHRTRETDARLEQLLDRFGDYPLVVEVRHASWNSEDFFSMLRARGVGFCNIDQPVIGQSIKPTERSTSSVSYVRLHGRRYDTWFSDDPTLPSAERYNYLYSPEELREWARRIRHIASNSKSTFAITNNHFEGKGPVNALELIHLLTGRRTHVPEPLRRHYPRLGSIAADPSHEPILFT